MPLCIPSARSDGGRRSCCRDPVFVSWGLSFQCHRHCDADADTARDVSCDERLGISANLMSLGGLAIAIGLMVDGSVVVVENVFAKLGHRAAANRRLFIEAVKEVATPVIFGICIIILVFLPLMTFEGMEGKMFAPLAYTIAIALAEFL